MCTPRMVSSTRVSLTRMPRRPAAATAAVSASGVAMPSAQGQAITSTAMACINAVPGLPVWICQTAKVIAARASTPGMNRRATRSTERSIFVRLAAACSTVRTMRASVLSAPTRVARISSTPPVLMLPPTTASPVPLGIGADSPVSTLSSTCERPSVTMPSAGRRSPDFTRKIEPVSSASTETKRSWPSCTRRALPGIRRCSSVSARMARSLAPRSMTLPVSTRVTMAQAVSK